MLRTGAERRGGPVETLEGGRDPFLDIHRIRQPARDLGANGRQNAPDRIDEEGAGIAFEQWGQPVKHFVDRRQVTELERLRHDFDSTALVPDRREGLH